MNTQKVIDEFEKEFEFQQKKLWQLPEETILERQTIQLIKDFCLKQKLSSLENQKKEILGICEEEQKIQIAELRQEGYDSLAKIITKLKKL